MSDAYANLIGAGHDAARIGQYTRRQLMLHLAAAERRHLQQRMEAIVDGAAANAGGKSANQWVATLSKARSKL